MATTRNRAPRATTTPRRLALLVGASVPIGVGGAIGTSAMLGAPGAGWELAVQASAEAQRAQNAEPTDRREPLDGAAGIEAFAIEPLLADRAHIRVLLRRDSIPALTDPATESVQQASTWMKPGDRVVVVGTGAEAVASPLRALNWHEIFNMTVGGEPIAVTYCPLCDSASVFSRRIRHDGEEMVLEFGTSGALYNSNVLMYDRSTFGL